MQVSDSSLLPPHTLHGVNQVTTCCCCCCITIFSLHPPLHCQACIKASRLPLQLSHCLLLPRSLHCTAFTKYQPVAAAAASSSYVCPLHCTVRHKITAASAPCNCHVLPAAALLLTMYVTHRILTGCCCCCCCCNSLRLHFLLHCQG
jgi:hypothetical protein